ncbi:NAD(P)H-dependent oxidoreductase [Micromonospora sp. ATA32]|nr:NAD(P)H-dependent oxidoreductase [Micromonospora sp. ATA32]
MTASVAPVPVTVLVGSPRKGSRTQSVAERVGKELGVLLAAEGVETAEPEIVDLAEIGALLPLRASRNVPLGPQVQAALDLVRRPGVLTVVSPTYKGTYTGMLKLFLDMLPIDGVSGCVGVAAMTAGWSKHRGAGDQFLRPLLIELGATVPVPALSILESEFDDLASVIDGWGSRHAPALGAVVTRMHRRLAAIR